MAAVRREAVLTSEGRDAAVETLLRDAAALLNNYGLRKSAAAAAIIRATSRVAQRWPEDPAAIDPETDSAFIATVLDELQSEARRLAH